MFSYQVGFNIEGKGSFNTCTGACLALVILILTLIYGEIKFVEMMEYTETSHQTIEKTLLDEDVPKVKAEELGLDWVFSLVSLSFTKKSIDLDTFFEPYAKYYYQDED